MNIPRVTKADIATPVKAELRVGFFHAGVGCGVPAGFVFRRRQLFQRSVVLVDQESRARIKKFYRREDACHTLIGRLLPRVLLKSRGVTLDAMTFAYTQEGKPYITTPDIEPVGYNVSHDNGVIAMAFGPGTYGAPAFNIGIDVMRVKIPRDMQFAAFVESVDMGLTPLEQRILSSASPDEGLRRFFWIWTLKEAYTKALGLGLGFGFTRIEYNVPANIVLIDGAVPRGWHFTRFEISVGLELYQGVVAEFDGGNDFKLEMAGEGWLVCYDAVPFVQRAIQDLQ